MLPRDLMSGGGSSTLGDPGASSHDGVDGGMSGVGIADGWGNLVFPDCSGIHIRADYYITTTHSFHS